MSLNETDEKEITCNKMKFTILENEKLKQLIKKYGTKDWTFIASMMPGRNPKQCKDRFCNYLSSYQKIGPWTQEEDDLLISLLNKIGPRWVEISRHIPKRSGNDAKNRWYKHLKKFNPELNEILIMRSPKKKRIINKNNFSPNKFDEISSDVIDISESYEDSVKKYSIEGLLV